jgi:hypothetical protein
MNELTTSSFTTLGTLRLLMLTYSTYLLLQLLDSTLVYPYQLVELFTTLTDTVDHLTHLQDLLTALRVDLTVEFEELFQLAMVSAVELRWLAREGLIGVV